MAKDTQSRKWQLTINNPDLYNLSHDFIKKILIEFKSCVYWCMADEIGEEGTYHTHLFLAFASAVRFSTLKNHFSSAHFEMAKGTCGENRDYITKSGKWINDRKAETSVADTFEEFGNMPMERQGQRNDINDLYDMIKQGFTNYEILELNPAYMLQIEKIERARQIVREEEYKNQFRNLEVTYIYGDAGSGKSRYVMDTYGYANVYRVTDYDHPFDSYKGQDIIVFEEFHSSQKIESMLNYLDGYPLELPCRYANKIACYTKVFITSNLELEQQYHNVQMSYNDTWLAFLRRLSKISVYKDGAVTDYSIKDYFNRFKDREITYNPFLKKERYQSRLDFE